MMLAREQRVRQVAEELLQKTSHTVHIVEEVFGIPEVQRLVLRVCATSLAFYVTR